MDEDDLLEAITEAEVKDLQWFQRQLPAIEGATPCNTTVIMTLEKVDSKGESFVYTFLPCEPKIQLSRANVLSRSQSLLQIEFRFGDHQNSNQSTTGSSSRGDCVLW